MVIIRIENLFVVTILIQVRLPSTFPRHIAARRRFDFGFRVQVSRRSIRSTHVFSTPVPRGHRSSSPIPVRVSLKL